MGKEICGHVVVIAAMLIGLCGPAQAGKAAVAQWLCEQLGFEPMRLRASKTTSFNDESGNGNGDSDGDSSDIEVYTPNQVLDIAMPRWREGFVVYPIDSVRDVAVFRKRPFFLLVAIDAPLLVRFRRHEKKGSLSLEEFVLADDRVLYGSTNLRACMDVADVTIVNQLPSIGALHAQLAELNLTDAERLRPAWDLYFMLLASLAARRSNCMKRRVGAVLVKKNRVIATGYNGTPRNTRNCSDGGCKRCNVNTSAGHGFDLCLCLHAEENALLEAGR